MDRSVANPKESLEDVDSKAAEIDYLKRQRASINKVDQLIGEAEQSLKELRREFYQTSKDLQSSASVKRASRSCGQSNASMGASALRTSKGASSYVSCSSVPKESTGLSSNKSSKQPMSSRQRSTCSQGENASLYDEDHEKEVGSVELTKTNRVPVLTFTSSRSSILKQTHSTTNGNSKIPLNYTEPTPTDMRRFLNAKNSIYLKMASGSDLTLSDSDEFNEDRMVKIVEEPVRQTSHVMSKHSEARLAQALREAGIADTMLESGSIRSGDESTDFSKKTPPPSSERASIAVNSEALSLRKGSSARKTSEGKFIASTPELTKMFSSKTVTSGRLDGSAPESSRNGIKKPLSGRSDSIKKSVLSGGITAPLPPSTIVAAYGPKSPPITKKEIKKKNICPDPSECRILGLCPPDVADANQTHSCSPIKPPACSKIYGKKALCSHPVVRGSCKLCSETEPEEVSKNVEADGAALERYIPSVLSKVENLSKSTDSLKRKVKSQESMTRSPKKCCFAEPEVQQMCCPCPEDVEPPIPTPRLTSTRTVTSKSAISKTITPTVVISKTVTSRTESVPQDDKSEISDLSSVSDGESCSCKAEFEQLRGIGDTGSPRKLSSMLKTSEKKSPPFSNMTSFCTECKVPSVTPQQDEFVSEVSKIARAQFGLTDDTNSDVSHLNTITEKTEATSEDASQITDEVLVDKPKQLIIQHLPQIDIRPPLVVQKVFEIEIKPTGSVQLQIPPLQNICYEEVLHAYSGPNEEYFFKNLSSTTVPIPSAASTPWQAPWQVQSPMPSPIPSPGPSPMPSPAPSPALSPAPSPVSSPIPSPASSLLPEPSPVPSPIPSPASSLLPEPSPVPIATSIQKCETSCSDQVKIRDEIISTSKLGNLPKSDTSDAKAITFKPEDVSLDTGSQAPSAKSCLKDCDNQTQMNKIKSNVSFAAIKPQKFHIHELELSEEKLAERPDIKERHSVTPEASDESIRSFKDIKSERADSNVILVEGGSTVPQYSHRPSGVPVVRSRTHTSVPSRTLLKCEPKPPNTDNNQRRPTASEMVADILEVHHRPCGCCKHGEDNEIDLIIDENLDEECNCQPRLTKLVPSDYFIKEEISTQQLTDMKQDSDRQLEDLESLRKEIAASRSGVLQEISRFESREAQNADDMEKAEEILENAETAKETVESETNAKTAEDNGNAERFRPSMGDEVEANETVDGRIIETEQDNRQDVQELEEVDKPRISEVQIAEEEVSIRELTNSNDFMVSFQEPAKSQTNSENHSRNGDGEDPDRANEIAMESETFLFTNDASHPPIDSVVPKSISQYFAESNTSADKDKKDKKDVEVTESESERGQRLSLISPYMFGYAVKAHESLPCTDEVIKKALSDVDKDLLSLDNQPIDPDNCDCICKKDANQFKEPIPAPSPVVVSDEPIHTLSQSSKSSSKSSKISEKSLTKGKKRWLRRPSDAKRVSIVSHTIIKDDCSFENPLFPTDHGRPSKIAVPSDPSLPRVDLSAMAGTTEPARSSSSVSSSSTRQNKKTLKTLAAQKKTSFDVNQKPSTSEESIYVVMHDVSTQVSLESTPSENSQSEKKQPKKSKKGYSKKKTKVKSKDQQQQSQTQDSGETSDTTDGDSCEDEPPNPCVTMQPVMVRYETKGVQKSLEDGAFPFVKLHKFRPCDDESSSVSEVNDLANSPLRNAPFGDTMVRPDFISTNLSPMPADLRQMEARQSVQQKPRALKVFKASMHACSSSSETNESRLEESLSDGEIKCRCSVSIGEFHLCRMGKDVKAKAAYLKKHPDVLVRREFPGENVILKKQRAIYDNWVTFYAAKLTPATPSSSDTGEMSTEK
ncbi:hypothetical protein Trydic_g391 [Trypoxylus dichotomus]